jgi:hypothetical protein
MSDDAAIPEKRLLDKLLAERDELDQHIAFLEKRLGVSGAARTAPLGPSRNQEDVSNYSPLIGEFFGLSRPQAAASLLKKAKQNLTTNQIFETLKEAGYEGLSTKNAFNGLYTALIRASEVTKVAPNTWGLREWYPHLKEVKKRVPVTSLDGELPLNSTERERK